MTLDKYILREHLVPFLFGFLVVTFLLSMDFIFDYIDLFLTKGVPGLVVLELYLLGLGWMCAMSIPCAALVAPLMAYGRMAQDNEITALKGAGVHLFRVVRPALGAAVLLAIALTKFNNHILPETNHRFANLLADINRKRPTLEITEGVFIHDLPGYSLLVESVDPRTSELTGVTIYEKKGPDTRPTTIIAKRGHLAYGQGGETLTFTLYDGEIHQVPEGARTTKYQRLRFNQHVINIKGISSDLVRTDRSTRSDREMSTKMMRERLGELETERQKMLAEVDTLAATAGLEGRPGLERAVGDAAKTPWWHKLRALGGVIRIGPRVAPPVVQADSTAVLTGAAHAQAQVKLVNLRHKEKRINAFRVEIHKKFAIPVACVVFVLIGAPLGIRAKRGGVAVGFVSVLFFLFYYICLIGGEQLADRLLLPPWLAMWIANLVLGSLGLWMTLRAIEATPARSSRPPAARREAA